MPPAVFSAAAASAHYSRRLTDALRRLDALVDWERQRRAVGAQRLMRVDVAPAARLLAALHDPHRTFTPVHVSGSKGKGTVAAYLSAALLDAGRRVGTYGSPHVERINERVRVNAEPLHDDALADALHDALDAARGVTDAAGPTWFDVMTAAGFLAMARAECEYAVVECGMGGRLDSTNVLGARTCVLTNVAREHAEIIGPTLADIAREKAGIAWRPGCTLVTGVCDGDDDGDSGWGGAVEGSGARDDASDSGRAISAAIRAGATGAAHVWFAERARVARGNGSFAAANRDVIQRALSVLMSSKRARNGGRDDDHDDARDDECGHSPAADARALVEPNWSRLDPIARRMLPGRMEWFRVPTPPVPRRQEQAFESGMSSSSSSPPPPTTRASSTPATTRVLIDGAHVPNSVSLPPHTDAVILGVGREKDVDGIVRAVLAHRPRHIVCTAVGAQAPYLQPDELYARVCAQVTRGSGGNCRGDIGGGDREADDACSDDAVARARVRVERAPTPTAALDRALDLAAPCASATMPRTKHVGDGDELAGAGSDARGGVVAAVGSLHLAGGVRAAVRAKIASVPPPPSVSCDRDDDAAGNAYRAAQSHRER